MLLKFLTKAAVTRSVAHGAALAKKLFVVRNYCNKKGVSLQLKLPSKLFQNTENLHAFNVLSAMPGRPKTLPSFVSTNSDIDSLEQFEAFLNREWSLVDVTEVVRGFYGVLNYSVANGITLSDVRFDKLTIGLLDHAEHLSDEQLADMLICLKNFPPCESYQSHNFHDIWSALDDVCCWKLGAWDVDTLFYFASLWYQLHLGRLCDTIFRVIDRCSRRVSHLTKEQLLQTFFYLNVCRRQSVVFGLESALEKHISDYTVDELAVIAMGFFKSKSKIKLATIAETMIDRLIAEHHRANEITISAILKILRFSTMFSLSHKIPTLLDKLTLEVDRLSNVARLHIALLGTTMQIMHEESLRRVAALMVSDIGDRNAVRLKDIERLLMALTMFDLDPRTEPDVFLASLRELESEERVHEYALYPKCLPCALNYLSIRNVYSDKLLHKVLDREYREKTYGRHTISRELYSLDCCIEIERSDYTGNRLGSTIRHKYVKFLIEWPPTRNQTKRPSATVKVLLAVADAVAAIAGGSDYLRVDHVLPHFIRADVIFCRDKSTGEYVKPDDLNSYLLGDIKRPPNLDKLVWYSATVLGWNNVVRDAPQPLGAMLMKQRHLRAIGYQTFFVPWYEFTLLSGDEQIDYIAKNIDRAYKF